MTKIIRNKDQTLKIKNLFENNDNEEIYSHILNKSSEILMIFEQSIFFKRKDILIHVLDKKSLLQEDIEKGLYICLKKNNLDLFKVIYQNNPNFDLSFKNNLLFKYAIKKESEFICYDKFIEFFLENNENLFFKSDYLFKTMVSKSDDKNLKRIFEFGNFDREQFKPKLLYWLVFHNNSEAINYAQQIVDYSINQGFKRKFKIISHLKELFQEVYYTHPNHDINNKFFEMQEYIRSAFFNFKLENNVKNLKSSDKKIKKI